MARQEKGEALPAAVRQMAARRLLARVAEAYGRMLLLDGLFQADCHPGNILVKPNGNIGAPPTTLPQIRVSLVLIEGIAWFLLNYWNHHASYVPFDTP